MQRHEGPKARAADGSSTAGVGVIDPTTTPIIANRQPGLSTVQGLWRVYRDAFTDVSPLAAQQHCMTFDEFFEVATEERIVKFYPLGPDGLPVGVAVMTAQLHAWPLVSPAFFARKYPGRAVFYIGFVAVAPGRHGLFHALIERMYQDVIAADGVAVMDFAMTNARIPKVTDRMLRSINPAAQHELIDRQEFHAWDFRTATEER